MNTTIAGSVEHHRTFLVPFSGAGFLSSSFNSTVFVRPTRLEITFSTTASFLEELEFLFLSCWLECEWLEAVDAVEGEHCFWVMALVNGLPEGSAWVFDGATLSTGFPFPFPLALARVTTGMIPTNFCSRSLYRF